MIVTMIKYEFVSPSICLCYNTLNPPTLVLCCLQMIMCMLCFWISMLSNLCSPIIKHVYIYIILYIIYGCLSTLNSTMHRATLIQCHDTEKDQTKICFNYLQGKFTNQLTSSHALTWPYIFNILFIKYYTSEVQVFQPRYVF